ncbi:uncharacterized protein [Dermacentor albipictus]|uniref:uncharacterized protein n=1 Tax=Dermacentor albipictus TaxID=60249 RepID=UPI0038FC2238
MPLTHHAAGHPAGGPSPSKRAVTQHGARHPSCCPSPSILPGIQHICDSETIPHGEVLERMERCAAVYQLHGIGKGDRVYAHVSNSIENFIAVCAITLTGATLVTSDVLFREGELLANLQNSDATHVLTDATFAPTFIEIKHKYQFKGLFSTRSFPGFVCLSDAHHIGKCLKYNEPDASPHDVIIMCHTSGTTGISKIMEVEQQRFLTQMRCREVLEMVTSDDVAIGGGNISFFFFFSFVFNVLSAGATIVLLKSTNIRDLFEACNRHKVNLLNGTPQKLLKIAEAAKASGTRLPTVKKLRTQGVFLPERIAKDVVSIFEPDELRDCYGMTEVSGFLAVPPRGELPQGNVGFPVCGTKMKVVNPENRTVLGAMEIGEVLFQSPYVMRGYYKNAAATRDFIDSEGWLHTGDLGYYDNDGRLFLAGRLKDTMFRMSKHMNPAEIEQCLYAHWAIAEAAVLPVPRDDTDDDPAAIIVLKEGIVGDQRLAEDIKAFVAERLAPYKHLHGGVFFAECIPKTSFGKFKRRLLPDMLKSLKGIDKSSS